LVLIGEQFNASRSLENPVRKMERLLAQLHWLHEPDLAWPMLLAFLAAEQEEPAAGSCGNRIVDAAMSRLEIALLLQQCYGQAGPAVRRSWITVLFPVDRQACTHPLTDTLTRHQEVHAKGLSPDSESTFSIEI
jgi:hypothetical protein